MTENERGGREGPAVLWDAGLADHLDEVRHDGDRPLDALVEPTLASLRSHGFALLGSLDRGRPGSVAERLQGLGERLGRIVPQSPRGEMIEDVRDVSDIEERDDRGYRSGGELSPHSDPPTLIILHCVTAARSGGESHLVNVGAIRARIATEDPAALDTLYQPFPMWRVEGQGGRPAGPDDRSIPVLAERGGITSCVLYRPYIELGADALDTPLTSDQVSALDAFDRHSHDPTLALRFTLSPGETLVLHNRAVLHARTDFDDHPELARRRHLLRLWIDAPDALPADPAHELGDIFAA
jgi:hypothetical protein